MADLPEEGTVIDLGEIVQGIEETDQEIRSLAQDIADEIAELPPEFAVLATALNAIVLATSNNTEVLKWLLLATVDSIPSAE